MWTTIRHLVWHDARALRVTLAVWAGVLALQAAVVAVGPVSVASGDEQTDVNVSLGAAVIRLTMAVILTALIIQRDTAVGTTAFWLTRPISRVAMWTAKLVSIAGWCLLLPAAMTWALFVGLGLSAGSALEAAWRLSTEQTIVVAFAVMAASVTASLADFVVAGLAGFVAVWYFGLIAKAWVDRLPSITIAGRDSIFIAWAGAVIAGAIAVSVHQYWTRRRARTWVLVVVSLLLAQVSLYVVRNTIGFEPAVWSRRAYMPPSDVEVRLGEDVRDEPAGFAGYSGLLVTGRTLSTAAWATSSSDTDALEPVGVASSVATTFSRPPMTLQWSAPRQRVAWWTNAPSTADDQPVRSIRKALAVDRIAVAESTLLATPLFRAYIAEWPLEAYRAFAANGGGMLRAEVVVKAFRYRVGGAIPLREGASYSAGDRGFRITSVERTPRGIVLTVRTAFVSPVDTNVARQGGVHYVLRNRARREAVFFTSQETTNTLLTLGAPLGPGTGLRRFEFDSQRPSSGTVALTDAWIDAAELVVLVPEDLGVFTRSAEVPVLTTGAAK